MVEVVINGRGDSKVVPLAADRSLVIGRSGKLRIDDRQLSRQHARLVQRGDACYVEDLGSKNGTYVNRVRVTSIERVQEGDTIRVGSTTLIVRRPRMAADAPTLLSPAGGRRQSIDVPDVVHPDRHGVAVATPSTVGGDATARRWGPALFCGITLSLITGLLFSAIAHIRTVSALRALESTLNQRIERRDLELVAALRSDLRKPAQAPAELVAALAAQRGAAESAAEGLAAGLADRVDERFTQFHRMTTEELIELRRTIDALDKRLDAQTPRPQATAVANEHASPSSGAVSNRPHAPEAHASATCTDSADVVIVIDATRGLASTLPGALAQARLVREDLPAQQRLSILLAHQTAVTEIGVADLAAAVAGEFTPTIIHANVDAPASMASALALALRLRPRTLHVFTDNAGDPASPLRAILRRSGFSAESISITHFYTRALREDLKSIAREFGGVYSFVGHS